MNSSQKRLVFILMVFASLLLAAYSVSIILAYGKTEKVTLNSFSDSLVVTASGKNMHAEYLGTGSFSVRLQPGEYQFVAGADGNRYEKVVVVKKRKPVIVSITKSMLKVVTSPSAIKITDSERLISMGMTETQLSDLRRKIFTYDRSIKGIDIDVTTVKYGYRNRNSSDPFAISFQAKTDEKNRSYTVVWYDLKTVQVKIADPETNTQLYDSGTPVSTLPHDD